MSAVAAWRDKGFPKEDSPLSGTWPIKLSSTTNALSLDGHRHLTKAAHCILSAERLERRITKETARRALLEAYDEEIARVLAPPSTPRYELSSEKIVRAARRTIAKASGSDGVYVFPVVLGRKSKATEFRFGPIEMLSAERFVEKYDGPIQSVRSREGGSKAADDWHEYAATYDHFACVELMGYEAEQGWKAARDAAEAVLNLVRITFGFSATDRVRLGLQLVREPKQARLILRTEGSPSFSISYGGVQPLLADDWPDRFRREIGPGWVLVGEFLRWFLENKRPDDPIIQRLIYANRLFAEAYSEPSEPIRLVRVVSALEALAATADRLKAHSVALRSSYAGGWGDSARALEAYDAVREAYRIRNLVVHGDIALDDPQAQAAFLKLDKFLLPIVVGFYAIYRHVSSRKPQSISALRRALDEVSPWMLWCPSDFF